MHGMVHRTTRTAKVVSPSWGRVLYLSLTKCIYPLGEAGWGYSSEAFEGGTLSSVLVMYILTIVGGIGRRA